MQFGVFIQRDGCWHLWGVFNSLTAAKAEAVYLTNVLGVHGPVQVFRRKA